MPCEECENEKYKWGQTGECQYETLEDCQLANQGEYLEETLKPKSNEHIDFTMHFTKEQMDELHEEGEVLIEVDGSEEGEKMNILFTYDKKEEEEEEEIEKEIEEEIEEEHELEKEYAKLTKSMLDDELDEYIDKITNAIKKL